MAPGRCPAAYSSVSRTSMTVAPSWISSLTSEGSTSSIWLLTWRRSSAPDGLISKLLNHGRDSLTSKSIAVSDGPSGVPRGAARARCRDRRATAERPHSDSPPASLDVEIRWRRADRSSRAPARSARAGRRRGARLPGKRLRLGQLGGRRRQARLRTPRKRRARRASTAQRCLPACRPRRTSRCADLAGGAPVSLASYRGRVTIVAFPYSTCGADVCRHRAADSRSARRTGPVRFSFCLISANPSD